VGDLYTVAFTIPLALFMDLYIRYLRPGRIGEVSVIGLVFLVFAISAAGWRKARPGRRSLTLPAYS
jgi:carbon starvation protein